MVVSVLVHKYFSNRDVNSDKKNVRAISALTSVASDFDIIADWWFYAAVKNESEVSRPLKDLQLGLCIVGIVTWMIVTSNGLLIKPLLRRFNVRHCTTGHLLFLSVLVEDIPQVVLTFYIEKLIDDGRSTYAVINLMTAVYDILIKLAEAYDERQGYHDTSGWLLKDFSQGTSRGHLRNVNAIVNVSSKSFLSGSSDKTLKLWHCKKDDPIQNFKGHTHRVSSVDVLNEYKVLSGSWDETAKLWDVSTGKCILSFVGHEDAVTSVIAFDESKIITGSFDNTSKLWDVNTGRCRRTFRGHTYRVNSVAKINGTQFVSGSADLTAKLWDIKDKKCLRTFIGHSQSITCVARAGPDTLLTGSSDKTSKIWDVDTGNCLHTFSGHDDEISFLSDFDHKTFLTASNDKTMRLWNKNSGECLRIFQHNHAVLCVTKLDDETALTGANDKSIRHWSITNVKDKTGNRLEQRSASSEIDNKYRQCYCGKCLVNCSIKDSSLDMSHYKKNSERTLTTSTCILSGGNELRHSESKDSSKDESIENVPPNKKYSTRFWRQLDNITEKDSNSDSEVDLEEGCRQKAAPTLTVYERLSTVLKAF